MMRCFNMLTTVRREKADKWSLKRGAWEGRGSCRNSFLNAAIGYIGLLVATKIIYTPVYSISILLRLSYKTTC